MLTLRSVIVAMLRRVISLVLAHLNVARSVAIAAQVAFLSIRNFISFRACVYNRFYALARTTFEYSLFSIDFFSVHYFPGASECCLNSPFDTRLLVTMTSRRRLIDDNESDAKEEAYKVRGVVFYRQLTVHNRLGRYHRIIVLRCCLNADHIDTSARVVLALETYEPLCT